MKCPDCVKEGKQSCVYPEGGTRTLMYCAPYYDQGGNYHIHDSNIETEGFHCSNGHRWTERTPRNSCPTCGDNW